jgi:hypothetical protein
LKVVFPATSSNLFLYMGMMINKYCTDCFLKSHAPNLLSGVLTTQAAIVFHTWL